MLIGDAMTDRERLIGYSQCANPTVRCDTKATAGRSDSLPQIASRAAGFEEH